MNTRLVLSLLATLTVLTSAPAAALEPSPAKTPRVRKPIVYTPRPASDFAFLEPGKTTIEEAAKTLGDTKWAYRSYLVDDTVVAYLELADLPSLYRFAGDRPVESVEVRVYTAGHEGSDPAYLVFKNEVLLYAHHPVSASEQTREALEARYGKKLEVYTELPDPRVERVLYSTHLLRIPGETSFFYVEERNGAGETKPRVAMKVLASPSAKVAGYKRGDVSQYAQP